MKIKTLFLAGLLRIFSNVFYYFNRKNKKLRLSQVSPEEVIPEEVQQEPKHDL